MTSPIDSLTLDELDALITITRADMTWHSPEHANRAWAAIDQLLDQRNKLTQANNN